MSCGSYWPSTLRPRRPSPARAAPGRALNVRLFASSPKKGTSEKASNLRFVMPAEFQPFFVASVAASSALIGLLFVSVSIAPERIFGEGADPRKQALAVSAFSALANVFFISMASLIPGVLLGLVVTIVAAASSAQLLGPLVRAPVWRGHGVEILRGALLFLASALIYGTELYLGVVLWIKPASSGALTGLLH